MSASYSIMDTFENVLFIFCLFVSDLPTGVADSRKKNVYFQHFNSVNLLGASNVARNHCASTIQLFTVTRMYVKMQMRWRLDSVKNLASVT